jgi:hypothetical protein
MKRIKVLLKLFMSKRTLYMSILCKRKLKIKIIKINNKMILIKILLTKNYIKMMSLKNFKKSLNLIKIQILKTKTKSLNNKLNNYMVLIVNLPKVSSILLKNINFVFMRFLKIIQRLIKTNQFCVHKKFLIKFTNKINPIKNENLKFI